MTVSPGSASVYADEAGNTWPESATQEQFSATVNNGSSQNVTWAVTGGASNGAIKFEWTVYVADGYAESGVGHGYGNIIGGIRAGFGYR